MEQDPTIAVAGDPASPEGIQAEPTAGESQQVQPPEGGNAEGKLGENLPPELEETRKQLLRDYHSKTKKLSEDRMRFEKEIEGLKSKSSVLDQLMTQEWFKKAAEDERARRSGGDLELTDEAFESIKSDKNAFKAFVQKAAESMVQGKVNPALETTRKSLSEIQTEREFDRVAAKYQDFKSLDDQGLLDPYLKKGLDHETAYKAYVFDNKIGDIDSLAAKKAEEILRKSREGAISKGGTPQINGQLVLKARNFDDAFDKVMDAIQRGNKDFKLERQERG